MKYQFNDGGRSAAGYKGDAGDCVVRAIAIASGLSYQAVYDDLHQRNGKTPRNGIKKKVYEKYLAWMGYKWTATMGIGTGCKVHLKEEELPKGTIIVRLSRHLATVIDGTLHDTHDCSRDGSRCVYGYWVKP